MRITALLALFALATASPSFAQETETDDDANGAVAAGHSSAKPVPAVDINAYIAENASLPPGKSGKKETLRLTVKFIIDEKGDVADVKLAKSSGNKSVDEEAIRVVEAMPRWTPKMVNGKPAKVFFTLPIKFVLEPDEDDEAQDRVNRKKEKTSEDKEAREERLRERREKKDKEEE